MPKKSPAEIARQQRIAENRAKYSRIAEGEKPKTETHESVADALASIEAAVPEPVAIVDPDLPSAEEVAEVIREIVGPDAPIEVTVTSGNSDARDTYPKPIPQGFDDLLKSFLATPDGRKILDERLPTGSGARIVGILEDNARIAFLAGYNAARP